MLDEKKNLLSEKQQKFFDLIGIQPGQIFKDKNFSEIYKFEINEDGKITIKWKNSNKEWENCSNLCCGIDSFINVLDRLEIIKPKHILTTEEKKYLENICKPFKDKVIGIMLDKYEKKNIAYVVIIYTNNIENKENKEDWRSIRLQEFEYGTMYEGMELQESYSLEDLEMFENYTISLRKFYFSFNKDGYLKAIHCKTKEQSLKLCEAFKKRGYYDYKNSNIAWDTYKEELCYFNDGCFADRQWCYDNGTPIYEFDEVDLDN